MNFDRASEWLPSLWAGLQLTVFLTFASMALALVIGLFLALAQLDTRKKYFSWPARAFVELIRGTPLLLQLFYIYYVFPFFGLRLDPIVAGVIGLGINTGAYLSEVFRSGIDAVDKGQWEAADALGMPTSLTLRHVILPQAFRIVIPPVGNYFISLFKDTALVSTISVSELLFSGQLLAAQTFRYIEIYSIIFVIYLAISYPASLGVRSIERRLRISSR
ncbi:MAG TPA: ectoine/hydroxyectoine ABC transporter permease subunit EhuD [Candidatus Saccharimonadales bacterium]|nr:ectoine/hydroxyectoine ABC transporter permease subunit EhuD [Candidatus Saccharimonadales bacterium]